MTKVSFVGIDWQNDFVHPQGSLAVPTADKAAERTARFVRKNLNKIYAIDASLDTHGFRHIAHPIWWVDVNGEHPEPFTIITTEDVIKGTWKTSNPLFQERALSYVKELEANAKYVLCIWPPHCLIGSWGHNVYDDIYKSFRLWEQDYGNVNYHVKGSNPFTEHYSSIQADVPDPSDPSTMIDTKPGSLICSAINSDLVILTGIASSHCLANTISDMVELDLFFDQDKVAKMVILEDATAPVPGFEKLADEFFQKMITKGIRVSTTDKFKLPG